MKFPLDMAAMPAKRGNMLRPQHVIALLILALVGAGVWACSDRKSPTSRSLNQVNTQVGGGVYKVGKPYQIASVWYYPEVDYDYEETGIASWYGPGFHGKRTANGEIFDEEALTAAHRTLPMPSMVRVTNLDNGRSIAVKVNDRGPFAHGRIIDLSKKAAEVLGFKEKGTAAVRVEILAPESRRMAVLAQGVDDSDPPPAAAPIIPVERQGLDGVQLPVPQTNLAQRVEPVKQTARTPVVPDGKVTEKPVDDTDIFVQAGAFTMVHNAERLKARLTGLGPSRIVPVEVQGKQYFRVRLGPVASLEDADKLLATLIANGFSAARLVVE